jgi:hypothetical protein
MTVCCMTFIITRKLDIVKPKFEVLQLVLEDDMIEEAFFFFPVIGLATICLCPLFESCAW